VGTHGVEHGCIGEEERRRNEGAGEETEDGGGRSAAVCEAAGARRVGKYGRREAASCVCWWKGACQGERMWWICMSRVLWRGEIDINISILQLQ
jgi:hypothetical protein